MTKRSDLTKRFDKLLVSYAVKNEGNHGRAYPESEHPDKLPFQRDRDRIIHSKAFRRLKHKTQVMVSPTNDHFRDRLTHSIEGSQIARSVCRALQLNEDLAEAAILAHDLGHPPFGHEGEYALDEMLKPLGFSFDHNEHSYRIVTKLERNYPGFPGLNLTKETLAALQKHHVPWEAELPGGKEAQLPHQSSLEAQIVNLADEIAYYSHDIDDGIRSKILGYKDFSQLEIGQLALELTRNRYPMLNESDHEFKPQITRSVVHLLITDIIEVAKQNIKEKKLKKIEQIYASPTPIIHYSNPMEEATQALRSYLYKNFYHSESVIKYTIEGKELLKELFTRLYENPVHLPQWIQDQIDAPEPKAIVVKDYIAGMTDNFAREMVFKLRKRLI